MLSQFFQHDMCSCVNVLLIIVSLACLWCCFVVTSSSSSSVQEKRREKRMNRKEHKRTVKALCCIINWSHVVIWFLSKNKRNNGCCCWIYINKYLEASSLQTDIKREVCDDEERKQVKMKKWRQEQEHLLLLQVKWPLKQLQVVRDLFSEAVAFCLKTSRESQSVNERETPTETSSKRIH